MIFTPAFHSGLGVPDGSLYVRRLPEGDVGRFPELPPDVRWLVHERQLGAIWALAESLCRLPWGEGELEMVDDEWGRCRHCGLWRHLRELHVYPGGTPAVPFFSCDSYNSCVEPDEVDDGWTVAS